MLEFFARHGTLAQCEAAVAAARWPDVLACPRCQRRAAWTFQRNAQSDRQCAGCDYQCSLIAGTLLKHKIMEAMRLREQDSKLHGRGDIDDAYLGGERCGGNAWAPAITGTHHAFNFATCASRNFAESSIGSTGATG